MGKNSKYPNLYQCIVLIAFYYILQLAASLLLNSISHIFQNAFMYSMFSNTAVLAAGLLTIYYAASKNEDLICSLLFSPGNSYRLGCYAVILVAGAELIMYAAYYAVFPQIADSLVPFNREEIITVILFKILLFPIVEEVIFRGIILNGLSKNYNISKAIVISALIFGILHFNLIRSVTAFIFGLVIGYIYISTRSVYICIFAHVIKNTLAVNNYVHYHLIHNMNFRPGIYLIFGIILTAAGFYLLSKTLPMHQSEEVSEQTEI